MSLVAKPKRNGNDELPTDRSAVRIVRSSRNIESPNRQQNSPTKQPVTKVAKLVYEPKRQPTSAVVKSIHSYRSKGDTTKVQNYDNKNILKADNRKDHNFSRENTLPARPALEAKFTEKRLKRQIEANEINEMLKGISNKTNIEKVVKDDERNIKKPKKDANPSKSVYNDNANWISGSLTARSKTEPNFRGRSRLRRKFDTVDPYEYGRRSARSKSVNSASYRTNSSDPTPRLKSYDPEKARQFMQEQKERRKEAAGETKKGSTTVNREEIKKRLENLRKNTLAILQKNIKRARNKSLDRQSSIAKVDAQPPDLPKTTKNAIPEQLTIEHANIPKTIAAKSTIINPANETLPPKPATVRVKTRRPVLNSKKLHLNEYKKIGLLRKTDTESNEEAIEVPNLKTSKGNILFMELDSKTQSTKPISSNKVSVDAGPSSEVHQIELEVKALPDLELSVPDVKLKPRPVVEEKSVQAEPQACEKPALPYWLQPTPVQLYPYNFIKAVRRKLEAITNPVQTQKDMKTAEMPKEAVAEQTQKLQQPPSLAIQQIPRRRLLSRPELNEVSSINIDQGSAHKLSTASSVFTPFLNSPTNSPKKDKVPTLRDPIESSYQPPPGPPALDRSKSQSELTSSITINVPQSNTVSEVSSIHSEIAKLPVLSSTQISKRSNRLRRQRNDDDTTASSSVFSSPEKRLPAYKKQSEKPTVNTNSIANENQNIISPLSVDKINNLNLEPRSSIDCQASMRCKENFQQMLQDFNKSLSHAIEVNEKLQSVLSKSPRSHSSQVESAGSAGSTKRSPRNQKTASSKSESYSSDFEQVASDNRYNADAMSDAGLTYSKSDRIAIAKSNIETASSSIKTLECKPSEVEMKATAEFEKSPAVESSPSKNISSYTEDFQDSIEEASKTFLKIVSSPTNHNLQNSNNFSKDSLELQREEIHSCPKTRIKDDIIRNQINVVRGENYHSAATAKYADLFSERQSDSKLIMSDDSLSNRPILNSSMGSDIFAIFNQSEMEMSIISQSSRFSESNMNYSTMGLYEQLIKTEATKTEHLTALLKIREKSILDRTRGQIALLEIQKEKCKTKGLTSHISMIKRKQRAILLKMDREREEIRRILKLSAKTNKEQTNSIRSPKIPHLPLTTELSFRKTSITTNRIRTESSRVVRGYELESGHNLEKLLQERETELKRRREQVERLLQWHRRLDEEEQEVINIETMLYAYNQNRQKPSNAETKSVMHRKHERKLEEIDKSLRELQSITTNSASEVGTVVETQNDYVRTSGSKLNKLWRRLTGRSEQRFELTKKYKLAKSDLEKIYEDAKQAVLEDFKPNEVPTMLSDQTNVNNSNESTTEQNATVKESEVPHLNLNFSSATSDSEQVPITQSVDNMTFTQDAKATETGNNSSDSSANRSIDSKFKRKETDYTADFTSSESASTVEITTYAAVTPREPLRYEEEIPANTTSINSCLELRDGPNCEIDTCRSNNNSQPVEKQVASKVYYPTIPGADVLEKSEALNVALINREAEIAFQIHLQLLDEEKTSNVTVSPHSSAGEEPKIEDASHIEPLHIDSIFDVSIDLENESDLMIEDISAPKFESTAEDTKSLAEELSEALEAEAYLHCDLPVPCAGNLDESVSPNLEHITSSIEHHRNDALAIDLVSEENTKIPQDQLHAIVNHFVIEEDKENRPLDTPATKLTVKDFLLNPEATSSLMPDIINEVELRRRQQILAESDIIQLENTVPHVLLREIPNKPPPPYVPPAHGSPMTTIFPSEARIKEITFRRTKELYEQANREDPLSEKLPSILDENITNIYERIILDICKECIEDYQPTFTANMVVVGNYKMPLALYNPPNRLRCIQEFVYKRVRKLLSMDRHHRTRQNSIFSVGRRKRDHVDEILIQELFEEEHKWTNFDLEETEVRNSVVEEVFDDLIKELTEDFEEAYKQRKEREKQNEKTNL